MSRLVMIRFTRDGGRNWSDWVPRSLGEVGDFMRRIELRNLGRGRDWAFAVRTTDPVRADLIAATVQIEGAEP